MCYADMALHSNQARPRWDCLRFLTRMRSLDRARNRIVPKSNTDWLSWGEVFPPFLGNREHSTSARFILNEFPFRLFSSSTPYSELPQRLTLTFRYHSEVTVITPGARPSGHYPIVSGPDAVASEFAAFMSLLTRRRMFVVRMTRHGGLPIEEDLRLYGSSHYQARQGLREIEPELVYQLLEHFRLMDRRIAEGFLLAARLYHAGVEMLYSQPEFAYLFLSDEPRGHLVSGLQGVPAKGRGAVPGQETPLVA